VAALAREPAGNLFGGPTRGEAPENGTAQDGLPFQTRARPAPRLRLLVSITWLVTDLTTSIASYLTKDRLCRAIQSCRDLPDRSPFGLKPGNLATILQ
jgi:hypothetical protein